MKKINDYVVSRVLQIIIATIPMFAGIFALLNNIYPFTKNVKNIAIPLITMQGVSENHWRKLPSFLGAYCYTIMFFCEFTVGILAFVGVINMLKDLFKSNSNFEKSKLFVYFSCMLACIIYGLFFFVIGGDWFLAWMGNSYISGIQSDSLRYTTLMFFVFAFLKLSASSDII
ncbi:DUF2165 domain-containing protein [Enterobacter asburiae]|uniref:DUF2165 domain-containing protein n=1 Tax=Enterobacter asburiae TaxID=61645 RepID=UPI0021D2E01A|nr:DUF2165 domain-containing protein [Enterobacter asburiae]MCU6239928.1 DUF2165 domain-containing protein [Enterobacter asburiae]